jgi:hypothetical protein
VSAGCVDCEGLKSGTRRHFGPHQYLVASGRFGVVSSHEYRCLVCKSVLVCEDGESGSVWKDWASDNSVLPAEGAESGPRPLHPG